MPDTLDSEHTSPSVFSFWEGPQHVGCTICSPAIRLVLFVAFLFTYAFGQIRVSENRIRIETIVGKVKVCGSNNKCREARVGMPLHPHWYIRTFKESHVIIRFSNGTILKIDEQSIVSLAMYRGN